MSRHPDAEERKGEPLSDEKVHNRQADRDPDSSVHDAVEIAVFNLVIVLGVAFKSLLCEQIAVKGVDGLFPGGPLADTGSNFGSHGIQLVMIAGHIQRRIGVARDQKRPGFKAHRIIRERSQLRQLVLQLASSDLFEHGGNAVGHFGLFNFRFLEQWDG